MRNILSLAAVLLSATACIYPYDPDLEKAPEGVLVVDGDISIGSTTTLRLGTMYSLFSSDFGYSYSYTDEDGTVYSLADARAWVEDSEGDVYEGIPGLFGSGSAYAYEDWGYYGYNPLQFTVHTEDAPANREYRVCVDVFGARYSSDWTKPLQGPVINEISFVPNQDKVTVAVSIDGGPEATGYVSLSYEETWEFHTDYTLSYVVDTSSWTVAIPFSPPQQPNYWCWKNSNYNISYPVDFSGMEGNGMTAYPLFSFSRYDNRNHRKYCVNVTAKTLSKESYKYLSHLEEMSSGDGDLFTPNPGEIPGNLRCETDPDRRVLGYVTASLTTSKRAFLDNRYYLSSRPNLYALYFITQDKYASYYHAGFLPLVENPRPDFDPEAEGPYGWGPKRCYDCIAAGGTKDRPAFWDEDL